METHALDETAINENSNQRQSVVLSGETGAVQPSIGQLPASGRTNASNRRNTVCKDYIMEKCKYSKSLKFYYLLGYKNMVWSLKYVIFSAYDQWL